MFSQIPLQRLLLFLFVVLLSRCFLSISQSETQTINIFSKSVNGLNVRCWKFNRFQTINIAAHYWFMLSIEMKSEIRSLFTQSNAYLLKLYTNSNHATIWKRNICLSQELFHWNIFDFSEFIEVFSKCSKCFDDFYEKRNEAVISMSNIKDSIVIIDLKTQ